MHSFEIDKAKVNIDTNELTLKRWPTSTRHNHVLIAFDGRWKIRTTLLYPPHRYKWRRTGFRFEWKAACRGGFGTDFLLCCIIFFQSAMFGQFS